MTPAAFLALLLLPAADVEPILPASDARVSDRVASWLSTVDEPLADEASRQWADSDRSSPRARFDALLRIAYLVEPSVRELIDAAGAGDWAGVETRLAEWESDPLIDATVRLFVAKSLIAVEAADAAEQAIENVEESDCVDPAALLFVRAVCFHNRLDKEHGLPVLDRLTEPASQVAERYRAVARLMKQDLADLEDNDLAQTARQMRDIQRQLQQGKSGQKIQQGERQILERLDKMIEGMEQQLQQSQQQGGGTPMNSPNQPADDSRLGGQSATDDVDKRPIGKTPGWGNLPEKARTEARNLIDRQFPSHYRRAVEEYLKKLAERPAN